MGTFLLWAVLVVAVTGLVCKFIVLPLLQRWGYGSHELRITSTEYLVVLAAAAIVIGPIVGLIGSKIAVADKITREEFLNGYEQQVHKVPTKCYAGTSGSSASSGESNCQRTYVSGRYSYTVLETCTSTDAKGNTTTTPCLKTYWADIHTPYATEEFDYSITHDFGDVTIATGVLDTQPVAFNRSTRIPASIPRGDPPFWTDAKRNIEAHTKRGVTVRGTYENFILAADNDLLKDYAGDVEYYKSRKLLPTHTRGVMDDPIHDFYQADKISFVGANGEFRPANDQAWQEALMRFNGALGTKLRGDLHAVAIDANLVDSPTKYLTAFKAYNMSEELGKRQLSKNTIVLALGVKDGKIAWAKATTGMPRGNEAMLTALELRLRDVNFTPEALFGVPTVTESGDTVTVNLGASPGIVAQTMFVDYPFARACMKCEDKEEAGMSGYVFLEAEVKPSDSAYRTMVIIVFFLSCILWFLAGRYDPLRVFGPWRRQHDFSTNPDASRESFVTFPDEQHETYDRFRAPRLRLTKRK